MAVVRCPHCGTTNRAGSNYCNKCGVDLNAPEARPPAATTRADKRVVDEPAAEVAPQPFAPLPVQRAPAEPEQSPGAGDNATADQPWLRVEFSAGDEEGPAAAEQPAAESNSSGRLITGVQGLLAPVRVAIRTVGGRHAPPPVTVLPSPLELQAEQIRHVRELMSGELHVLPGLSPAQAPVAQPPLRRGWIVALLALVLSVPALFGLNWPTGIPAAWPGVAAAWQTVENLPYNVPVLVYWAYDPATAGEMDLVALPVMQHLLQRRARLTIISPLPGGPATARRVIEQARLALQRSERLTVAAESRWTAPIQYFAGGVSALPLVGQDPAAIFPVMSVEMRDALEQAPALAVVVAAETADVQQWLEQVQPLDRAQVVAATSAAADPFLRPYVDSGQLRGLVSGFDGAYHYQAELDLHHDNTEADQFSRQVVLQNWGQLAVIAIIVIGNLAALLGR